MSRLKPQLALGLTRDVLSYRFTALSLGSAGQQATFTTSRSLAKEPRKPRRDAQVFQQAKQIKSANLALRQKLKTQRQAAMGDPILGSWTSSTAKFDPHAQLPEAISIANPNSMPPTLLKHFLTKEEVDEAINTSRDLFRPVADKDVAVFDPTATKMEAEEFEQRHAKALAAIPRILSITHGNARDLKRLETQACISTFGRHATDDILPSKPRSLSSEGSNLPAEIAERAGPDTGSPEVQIALLTMKIRTLKHRLDDTGRTDRMNKRNLTVLVHRRQKLLKYLKRRERGGPRFQNLIDKLQLTEATWQQEISI